MLWPFYFLILNIFSLKMGVHKFVVSFLFALVFARVELSVAVALKGFVSCLDCHAHYDLSDIKVQVKCSQVKKLTTATTSKDGSFETDLPSDINPINCQAKIIGAATQLYVSKRMMFSKISKALNTDNSYTLNSTLKFYTSCPLDKNDPKCRAHDEGLGSSLTIDLPTPPEWGLAPTSYYFPFVPIIGIP